MNDQVKVSDSQNTKETAEEQQPNHAVSGGDSTSEADKSEIQASTRIPVSKSARFVSELPNNSTTENSEDEEYMNMDRSSTMRSKRSTNNDEAGAIRTKSTRRNGFKEKNKHVELIQEGGEADLSKAQSDTESGAENRQTTPWRSYTKKRDKKHDETNLGGSGIIQTNSKTDSAVTDSASDPQPVKNENEVAGKSADLSNNNVEESTKKLATLAHSVHDLHNGNQAPESQPQITNGSAEQRKSESEPPLSTDKKEVPSAATRTFTTRAQRLIEETKGDVPIIRTRSTRRSGFQEKTKEVKQIEEDGEADLHVTDKEGDAKPDEMANVPWRSYSAKRVQKTVDDSDLTSPVVRTLSARRAIEKTAAASAHPSPLVDSAPIVPNSSVQHIPEKAPSSQNIVNKSNKDISEKKQSEVAAAEAPTKIPDADYTANHPATNPGDKQVSQHSMGEEEKKGYSSEEVGTDDDLKTKKRTYTTKVQRFVDYANSESPIIRSKSTRRTGFQEKVKSINQIEEGGNDADNVFKVSAETVSLATRRSTRKKKETELLNKIIDSHSPLRNAEVVKSDSQKELEEHGDLHSTPLVV